MTKPRLSGRRVQAAARDPRPDRDRARSNPDCDWTSVDWQSLTFVGERPEAVFRVIGRDAEHIVSKIADVLQDAKFTIPDQIVADIELANAPVTRPDGSILVTIEALTVGE